MSGKYHNLITSIISHIGGIGNVKDLTHCQTRLRFVLVDNNIDIAKLKSLEGVINVIMSGGQCQVVVGTHVKDVLMHLMTRTQHAAPAVLIYPHRRIEK